MSTSTTPGSPGRPQPSDVAPEERPPRRNARYTPVDADGPLPHQMVAAVPRIRADPLAFLASVQARHGDLAAFPMPRLPVVLVSSPTAARRVLVDNHRGWSKRTAQYGALSAVTGSGLLTSDGEVWRERRRTAQPAFHPRGLESVADESVAAARRMRAAWPTWGGVVDVDAGGLQATLEVVGRTLFGADVAQDGERLVTAVLEALEVVVGRVRTPLPAWLPTPARRRLRRAVQELDEASAALVARRRARGTSPDDEDLLALLLRAVDAGDLAPHGLRDELVTMVIAGHETVASALTWTLHLLAGNPSAQARVAEELDEVLGGPDDRGGRSPAWGDLRSLVRTRAAVEESLRLFPPAWVVSRRALAEDVLDGVTVPAGTTAVISPWLLHRRPELFPEPEAYRPERFEVGLDRAARAAYLPFGAGPRLCIGRDFALVETTLLVAELLRGSTVRPAPGERVHVDALVTMRPRGGLRLRVDPR
ncbi:cytochrome P450 [Pseudokineococcus basanitobsidens]|uniref:Cytochrome P450 n=1 Tax=Pseudokineococcus basanitobsidens TaxID=1926649 RepID=A0ABU8RJK9_9ACTN